MSLAVPKREGRERLVNCLAFDLSSRCADLMDHSPRDHGSLDRTRRTPHNAVVGKQVQVAEAGDRMSVSRACYNGALPSDNLVNLNATRTSSHASCSLHESVRSIGSRSANMVVLFAGSIPKDAIVRSIENTL